MENAINENVWVKSTNTGTALSEDKYIELKKLGKKLSEDEAKELIYKEFGFDKALINIVTEVASYEVNIKTKRLRLAEKYERVPIYNATDYNYIRFDVRGWQWEMIDGEIQSYCD